MDQGARCPHLPAGPARIRLEVRVEQKAMHVLAAARALDEPAAGAARARGQRPFEAARHPRVLPSKAADDKQSGQQARNLGHMMASSASADCAPPVPSDAAHGERLRPPSRLRRPPLPPGTTRTRSRTWRRRSRCGSRSSLPRLRRRGKASSRADRPGRAPSCRRPTGRAPTRCAAPAWARGRASRRRSSRTAATGSRSRRRCGDPCPPPAPRELRPPLSG